jgi:hypothetical protein
MAYCRWFVIDEKRALLVEIFGSLSKCTVQVYYLVCNHPSKFVNQVEHLANVLNCEYALDVILASVILK